MRLYKLMLIIFLLSACAPQQIAMPLPTATHTASPTTTPVCYPVYVGGKLIGNFCP